MLQMGCAISPNNSGLFQTITGAHRNVQKYEVNPAFLPSVFCFTLLINMCLGAHMLLTRWGKEDPDGAFASLKTVGLKEAGGTASSILGGLASIDPKRAIAWLEDPENQYANRPWMGHILAGTIGKEWVRQDPDAALAWANALPDSQRRGALGGILESLASSDPQQASLMVMELAATALDNFS